MKPAVATVLFDRECGFCIWTVHLLLRLDRRGVLRAEPIQDRRDLLPGMGDEVALNSFHLVEADGRVRSAGAALAAVLRRLPVTALVGAALGRLPRLAERAYRLVADHRGTLARAVPEAAKARARREVLGAVPGTVPAPSAGCGTRV